MIYPKNFEQKIGFNEIRVLLNSHCLSSMGRGRVEQMQFETTPQVIRQLHQQVHEFQARQNGLFRPNHFREPDPADDTAKRPARLGFNPRKRQRRLRQGKNRMAFIQERRPECKCRFRNRILRQGFQVHIQCRSGRRRFHFIGI